MSFSRRDALRVLGSATALPLLDPALTHHPLVQLDGGDPWQPRFLDPRDVETVASLAEHIIPRSHVPGARDAVVHEYIDFALSRADLATQRNFTDGLSWLHNHVAASRNRTFAELDHDQQHRLLEEISDTSRRHEPRGYAFFTQLKQLSIEGYYLSDIGMDDSRARGST